MPGEGLRIGTVRRPPRGVAKADFAARDYYDTWFPLLAPSLDLMKQAHAARTAREWDAFTRAYRKEMSAPDAAHAIALLAALSRHCDFSVGCYCEDASHCHRSILRQLLIAAGARVAS